MDVICIGILVADVVVKSVERLPDAGKLEAVDSITLSLGGCAANTAVGLSRLGHDVSVLGAIGDDGFGDFIVDILIDEGVDTTGIVRLEDVATSVTDVLVDSRGERRFLHFKGANARFTSDDLDLNFLELSRHLHIGGTFLMDAFDGADAASVLRSAKEKGITTSLDTAWDPSGVWYDLIEPMLEYVDIFLPSDEEAGMLSGEDNVREMARFFLAKGVRTVGIKCGSKGGYFRSEDDEHVLPPLEVDVVDTTGCGDAFCSGFISGTIDGLSFRECAKRAVILGSLCATGLGAIAALPTRSQLDKY